MTSPTLGRLLVRWEEEIEQGRELSPKELAGDRYELLEVLREGIALLKRARPTAAPGEEGGPGLQVKLSGHATVTVTAEAPTGPALGTGEDSALPQRVGRFEIKRFLGEGGFGQVYEAYDPSLKRAVALKLAKRGDDERRVERFLREARAAGVLTHPNIVAVYDSGSDGGEHYIASALVRGRPL